MALTAVRSVRNATTTRRPPQVAVASFLNYKSPRTTARYSATHAIPAGVPTLF